MMKRGFWLVVGIYVVGKHLFRSRVEYENLRLRYFEMANIESELYTIIWYYEEGKSKSDFVKKETVSITLPNVITLAGLKRIIR